MPDQEMLARADDFAHEGVRLAARRRFADAEGQFARAIEANPEHPTALLHLALDLAAQGRTDEALPPLRKALELRPDEPAFHLFAARVYFDAALHDEARGACRRALELSPQNDLAAAWKLLIEWNAGNRDAAIAFAPARLPDSTPFLARLLMLIESELRGSPVAYADPNLRVHTLDALHAAWLLWRAGLRRKKGDFAGALSYAEMIAEMLPGYAPAVELDRACRDEMLGAARRHVEESPDSPDERIELAAQLADHELYEQADREYDTAIRLWTEQGAETAAQAAHVLRLGGRIAFGCGRTDQALERLQAGVEPGFSMAETHYYTGLCRLARNERAPTLAEFEPLVSKVCWAVPLRLREWQSRRRMQPRDIQT